MEDKIKLFLKYINREKELRLQWDKEDGIDINSPDYKPLMLTIDRVKKFISYRNIRIEQAWFSKLNKGKVSRSIEEKTNTYEKERIKRHVAALNSLREINEFGETYGLEKIYKGQILEKSDIENYRNISVRNEETEFFLSFVDTLGRTSAEKMKGYFEEAGIEIGKEESGFIKDLQSNIASVENSYGVVHPPLGENDEVKFKDENTFGMQLN